MKKSDDPLKELGEIAPKLSKLEKKSFDEVPVNYFNSFSGSVMKKIREQELAEIAPTLFKVSPPLLRRGFEDEAEIPANYFNSFPEHMLKQISEAQTGKKKSSSSWVDSLSVEFEKLAVFIFRPRFAVAIAGTVSLVLVSIMFFVNTEQIQCAETDLLCRLENVSDEELNAYFFENADEFQKSVLDFSTDDKKIQMQMDNLNDLLNDLDDESLNNI